MRSAHRVPRPHAAQDRRSRSAPEPLAPPHPDRPTGRDGGAARSGCTGRRGGPHGRRAVLVARGWVPADQASPQALAQLEEPAGAPVIGLIKPSQAPPNGQPSTPPAAPQSEWFRIDIPAIQAQMPYALEPAWIQQLPETGRPIDKLPIREEPMALDEGNHMSYAVQWFSFALIAGFGYIMFVRYRERLALRPRPEDLQTSGAAEPVAVDGDGPPPGEAGKAETPVQKELEPPVPV